MTLTVISAAMFPRRLGASEASARNPSDSTMAGRNGFRIAVIAASGMMAPQSGASRQMDNGMVRKVR